MTRILHAAIRGRVQGVGYRAWVADTALRLDLTGWVRNRRDGSVEAVFKGADEAVAHMLAACRKGPRSAVVHDIVVSEAADEGWRDFAVRPTL
ncbi:acylphosphatase [Nordella sp. HKS 07]|uniref:acylphosphatase n=1 Tax=Nordella sp. HKS 07 TaxID=2712222 RepID=UPI0013E19EE5|nr:acylphosphatase [Nordella sp. HKS 07]QIG51269.1 acylphosphatase [Nordella sp. HKS 07]